MKGVEIRASYRSELVYVLPLIVGVAIACNSFLTRSLWLDETVTHWIVSGGFGEVIARSVAFQGQSPLYYLLLWGWTQVGGFSEFALRVPSIVFLAATIYFVHQWVREVAGGMAAAVAIVMLLSQDQFLLSMNARPYALALLCAVLALRAFSRLSIDTPAGDAHAGFSAGVYLTAAAYAHYLFFACALVGIVLARSQWRRAVPVVGAAAVLVSPGLWQIMNLSRDRDLRFLSAPTFADFLAVVFPVGAVLPVCVALCVVGVVFAKRGADGLQLSRMPIRRSIECGIWWLLVPSVMWVGAMYGLGLFTGRYVLWCMIGGTIWVALFISSLQPYRAQLVALLVISMLSLGRALDRDWHVEPWREAFAEVEHSGRCAGSEKSVLLHSGLIELESAEFLENPVTKEYLNAPARAYAPRLGVESLSATALVSSLADGVESDAKRRELGRFCAVVVLRKKLPPSVLAKVRSGAVEGPDTEARQRVSSENTVELITQAFQMGGVNLIPVERNEYNLRNESVYVAFPEPGDSIR